MFSDSRRNFIRIIAVLLLAIGFGLFVGLQQPQSVAEADTPALISPYWYLDEQTVSVLEITNNAQEERFLVPILLVDGSSELELPAVTLSPRESLPIDLSDYRQEILSLLKRRNDENSPSRWGDGSRQGSAWGSLRLEGARLAKVSSWIVTTNIAQSLSVNSPLQRASSARGAEALVGMWWAPTERTQVWYALSNPSSKTQTVQPWLLIDRRFVRGRSLTIERGQSELISLGDLLPDGLKRQGLPEVGTLILKPRHPDRGLIARALVIDEAVGLSTPLNIVRQEQLGGNELQSPGVSLGFPDPALGFPKEVSFSPHLLLSNLSKEEREVRFTLRSAAAAWDASIQYLGAGESRVLDLRSLHEQAGGPLGNAHVGLELFHDGVGGDVIAEMVTVDDTLNYSFYDPMFDVSTRSALGQIAISFNLSGAKNTLLVFKNTSPEEALYVLGIQYEEDGEWKRYESETRSLPGLAPAVIDLEAFRDRGLPDRYGNLLPRDVEFGNAFLVADRPVLIAGDPTFDPIAATCISCQDSCGNIIPNPGFVEGNEGECPEEGEPYFPPPPPQVSITSFAGVFEGGLIGANIDVTPSGSQITLDLSRTSGNKGLARFASNNSSSRTITGSATVLIKGVQESSAVDNMKLKASGGGVTIDNELFSVISVVYSPNPLDNIMRGESVPLTATVTPSSLAGSLNFTPSNSKISVSGSAPGLTVIGNSNGSAAVVPSYLGLLGPSVSTSVATNSTFTASSATVADGAAPSKVLRGCTWGLTYPENVKATITALRKGGTWCAVVTGLKGNYSLQARLLPGHSEVTGPGGNTTSGNFRAQVTELSALGFCPGSWYMLRAVQDHEQVHATRFEPALESRASTIESSVEGVCVSSSTNPTQAMAISAIKSASGFTSAESSARAGWLAEILTLVTGDHASGGPTETAERGIVGPMISSICSHAMAMGWPGSSPCP